jgi:hypothetical protein
MRRLAAIALLSGCSLITRFDLSRTSENSDAICADGIDNDGNGLTDCQDFACLGFPHCCNLPVIVLADDFQHRDCAQASCASVDPVKQAATCALDPSKWQPWGLPVPMLCSGGLSPYKSENCYDVGALATTALTLHPGLSVSSTVAGIPEVAGQLAVGLTLQHLVASGSSNCAVTEGFSPVIAAIQARTDTGYLFLASFDHVEVGWSPEIDDDGPHAIKLAVQDDRLVHWSLDGVEFAQSPSPISDKMPPTAYLGLAGKGQLARFLDVRVSDGTQCDAPGAWNANDTFVTLEGVADGNKSWDSYQTYAPAVTRAGNQTLLYYSGCTGSAQGGDCSQELGIGLATSSDEINFTRSMANPLYPPRARFALEPGILRDPQTTNAVIAYISVNALASQQNLEIYQDTSADQMAFYETPTGPALQPGQPGSWDDADICCASAITVGGQTLMWFAGLSQTPGAVWRIGLARAADGYHFVEDPGNPVLTVGGGGDYDELGVTDPEVLWDEARGIYRMWYTATALLGRTSLGYAVSTDGVRWHKFPGNPVLVPDDFQLELVGSPAVLADEGELRMWLHGRAPADTKLRIYALTNRGLAPTQ